MENASTNEQVILKWHIGKIFLKYLLKLVVTTPQKIRRE